MWRGNFFVPYFVIQDALASLLHDFSFSLGPLFLIWLLPESPDFRTKGWMFWSPRKKVYVHKSCCHSHWRIDLIFIVEAPHTVENWVIDLSRPYLSINPDGMWWTIQFIGVSKWIYWVYSFSWCTTMGGMNHHLPSDKVKTRNSY